MQNEAHADFLLRDKRDNYEEYMVTLFEKCNLACSFCWQNHDDITGLDNVPSKAQSLITGAAKSTREKIVFNLMGGELFADDVFTDKMYQDYVELITTTHNAVHKTSKKAAFTFCTNMVWSRPERVQALINELQSQGIDIKLTTSFDFTGRFNAQNIEVFKQNLAFFQKDVVNISIVLTAPNINEMLKDRDENFKLLYKQGYKLFFDYYSPERNALVMTPSDKLLLKAFYFLIDNYPNTEPVQGWIKNHVGKLTCKSSKMVLPSGELAQCGKLPNKETIIMFKKPSDMSNATMELSFMDKMGCMTCEYFTRCSLGCFLQHYFKGRDELDECVFKLTYDKIVKNQVRDDIYAELYPAKLPVDRVRPQA